MAKELSLKGTGVALVTPFTENGDIDLMALENMVNFVIKGGVDYIVALGTTAETPTLSPSEKKLVVDSIIKTNNNRLGVVLGMGGNNTQELVNNIKSQDFTAIDGILSVSPYYNKPGQEGIYRHFKEVALASPVPVILYNVPGRTSSNISADTCLRLANNFQKIIAVKEASGNFEQLMKIIANKPDNFHVISGDDAIAFPVITLGGSGVISVIANAFPQECSNMVKFTLNNELDKGRKLHYKMLAIIERMFAEGNPVGVKAYLAGKGLISNTLRLPLIPASEKLNKEISDSLKSWK